MKVLILAAGYGTRLYPATKYIPKPLLEVNGSPLIEYILDKVEGLNSLSKIIIVTNGRFFEKFKNWGKTSRLKKKIRIINDGSTDPKDRLGAVADFYLGVKKEGADDDYLVLGGDNFLDEPLEKFIAFARKKKPAVSVGIVDVKSKIEARNYGIVVLNGSKQVVDFQEKPIHPKSSLAAMCLYYFPREKLSLAGKCMAGSRRCFDSIGKYIGWLSKEDKVYGFTFKKMWFDVGRPETYRKLNRILKERETTYA